MTAFLDSDYGYFLIVMICYPFFSNMVTIVLLIKCVFLVALKKKKKKKIAQQLVIAMTTNATELQTQIDTYKEQLSGVDEILKTDPINVKKKKKVFFFF